MLKIPVGSLTPNPQTGQIHVQIGPPGTSIDVQAVYGRIVAPFVGGPNATGSVETGCTFSGAGTDPMGAWAFFNPPVQTPPDGPYTAVLRGV